MIALKDVRRNEVFTFSNQDEADSFTEQYENPNDLIRPNIIYFDGGGWNGHVSKIAYGRKGNIKIIETINKLTNNEAEYKACISAMSYASRFDIIVGDSQVIIKQLQGDYVCKAKNLIPLHKIALKIMGSKKLSVFWVRRVFNKAGREIEWNKNK